MPARTRALALAAFALLAGAPAARAARFAPFGALLASRDHAEIRSATATDAAADPSRFDATEDPAHARVLADMLAELDAEVRRHPLATAEPRTRRRRPRSAARRPSPNPPPPERGPSTPPRKHVARPNEGSRERAVDADTTSGFASLSSKSICPPLTPPPFFLSLSPP